MAEHIKTFLLVALVTVLIWIFAESESLRTEKLRVEVTIGSGNTGRIARVEPGQVFNDFVVVHLEGSTARIDALTRALREGIRLEPGMEGFPADPGTHLLDMRTVFRSFPAVRDSGATVVEVDPLSVSVTVDELVDRTAKVRVVVPDGQVDGVPEAIPGQVVVRLPSALAKDLPPGFEVTARVDPAALASLPEDRFATVSAVRIDPPQTKWGAEFVRVEPPLVDVKLTLRSRFESFVVASVPVHVRMAAAAAAAWDVDIAADDRLLSDVRVTGPREIIEQIRSEKLRIIAYVPLSFEDLDRAGASGQPLEREALFADIPAALTLRFDAPDRNIRLTVRKREAAVPGGSPRPPS